MIDVPFQVLVADYSSHSLLKIDIPTGEILNEIPYPATIKPIAILATDDKKTAYIPAAKSGGTSLLFVLSLETLSLYQLPVELPHPLQFALSPDGRNAYFVGPSNVLYHLDLISLTCKTWGSMPEDCQCTGITANTNGIYTVWEHQEGGTAALFNRQGELLLQCPFSGSPTALSLTKNGRLLVSYIHANGSEGIHLFDIAAQTVKLTSIPLICSDCARSIRAYPAQLILSPDETAVYIVNEDSSSLSLLSLPQAQITACIPIGHSLSGMALSSDGRFAAGASNAFADLCLIDLVNRRLLSVSNTSRELSGFITSI